MKKNNDALFYTCSLIEYIGRATKNSRKDVVRYIMPDIRRIYSHADVFHCEPIEKVADDFITRNNVPTGTYDNVAKAKYEVPDYWDIGEVFSRLIEDNYDDGEEVQGIVDVLSSWLAERIQNYNSDLYYQSREYLTECYREGNIIAS